MYGKYATKATIKRLKKYAKGRYYEHPACILLRVVEHAEEDNKIYKESQLYNAMKEYDQHYYPRRKYGSYCLDGIYYSPPDKGTLHPDEQRFFTGLHFRYENDKEPCVKYKWTHDLNTVIIRDINKLVKDLIEDGSFN